MHWDQASVSSDRPKYSGTTNPTDFVGGGSAVDRCREYSRLEDNTVKRLVGYADQIDARILIHAVIGSSAGMLRFLIKRAIYALCHREPSMSRVTSRSLNFIWNPRRVQTREGKSEETNLFPTNDWFSETVNFRFEFEEVIYRGLISHAALREHFHAADTDDGPMNAFVLNSALIAGIAATRVRTAESGVVRIESCDI
ncbi:hypothetical protein AWB64_05456 [Caballeronia sordidicola]|uniref:Uncharacterized protein n=1 Tax=Caballeronia sordidicola TaxID=196367 RepID=A0A158I599_CABSO|nr:hypothetical protein [Caballeronia sordidicola]SAL51200.1 hypothetical protein AWB64_05456 [Caballeronia sordidicola]